MTRHRFLAFEQPLTHTCISISYLRISKYNQAFSSFFRILTKDQCFVTYKLHEQVVGANWLSRCQALSYPYYQSTRWLACMIASNNILSNPANVTPPMQASLFYVTRCKAGGGNCWRHEKCRILVGVQSRQNASSPIVLSRMSWFFTKCSTIVCA